MKNDKNRLIELFWDIVLGVISIAIAGLLLYITLHYGLGIPWGT